MPELIIPPITNLMVTLTNQCTMRCPFCFVDNKPTVMEYKTLQQIISFLIQNSEICNIRPRLVYFGGEPMIEWDKLIVPATNYIRQDFGKPFSLSMTTNMTLLNKDRIQYIVDNQIDCLYSIDGDRETMAINRPMADGSNGFDIVDKNINMLIKYIPQAAARITLYEPTAHNFYHDIRYVERKGFRSISVLPNLFTEWKDKNVTSLCSQIEQYGDYLIDSFRAGRNPLIFQQYSQMFYYAVLANKCIELGTEQSLSKCHGYGKCGFGLSHHATTDYKGDIYGCLHPGPLNHDSIFYLGNVWDGVDVNRSKKLVELCDAETPSGLNCDKCSLSPVCDRGCAPNNYYINGTMTTPPKIFCHYYRALMNDAIRVCNVLGKEENELFRSIFQQRVMRG